MTGHGHPGLEVGTAYPRHGWLAEFLDPEQEKAYREANFPQQRTIVLAFFAVLIGGALWAVHATWPNVAGDAAAERALLTSRGVFVAICVGLFAVAYRTRRVLVLDLLVVIGGIGVALNTFDLQAFAKPDALGMVFRGLIVAMMVPLFAETRFPYFLGLQALIIGTIVYQFWTFLNLSPPEMRAAMGVVVFLAASGLLYRRQAEVRRRDLFALNARLRELVDDVSAAKTIAENANQRKTNFLANVSHELRTPLNAVIGMADALRHKIVGELTPKQVEYVADIGESGRHLLALINDLLDLSKIEAGKLEVAAERVVVGDVVSRSLVFVREQAADDGITFDLALTDEHQALHADPRLLKQMLVNLLSNAVKFSHAGGVITVSAGTDDAGDLIIAVTDEGVGMAASDIPLALAPFEQAAANLARTGTGLGLPLTRRLAELHGGRLELESVPGDGTTARIFMPSTRRVG